MAKIILYENMRAIPYVPFYLAHEHGFFSAEGIEVDPVSYTHLTLPTNREV